MVGVYFFQLSVLQVLLKTRCWGAPVSEERELPDWEELYRKEKVETMPWFHGELDPDLAAAAYHEELMSVFQSTPRFDLMFLGLGTDGHTASLFPGSPALKETRRWVVAHYVDALSAWRITLTPPILNAARRLVFLVSGESKADPLRDVLQGDPTPESLPAQVVQPRKGQTTWMVDQAAAAQL